MSKIGKETGIFLGWIMAGTSFANTSPSSTMMLERSTLPTFTPYSSRTSLVVGDEAGGPVRYNTRFPTRAGDPNPASYYRAQSFVGLGIEMTNPRGAWFIEGMLRRDLSHPTQIGRTEIKNEKQFTVQKFAFESRAVAVGWVFGTQYREAWWRSSLGATMDYATLATTIQEEGAPVTYSSQFKLWALSLRGRFAAKVWGEEMMDIHVGPEMNLPVFSTKSEDVDQNVQGWLSDDVDLKGSASIGIVLEAGLRL